MQNFAVMLFCLVAGFCLKRFKVLGHDAHRSFNAFLIYISLPATVLLVVPEILRHLEITRELMIPLSTAWITFLLAFVFIRFVAARLKWNRQTEGALILTVGLGNTSFVGIPLLNAIVGATALPTILLIDQTGSFLALATVGIVTAASYGDKKLSLGQILKRICTFPPFVSLILSCLMAQFSKSSFEFLESPLQQLAGPLAIIALLSVGSQIELSQSKIRASAPALATGLLLKLVVIPILLCALFLVCLGSHSFTTRVSLLESAMAPMITAAVLASDSKLDAELATLMVGIGIPLSLLTVPTWNWILIHAFAVA